MFFRYTVLIIVKKNYYKKNENEIEGINFTKFTCRLYIKFKIIDDEREREKQNFLTINIKNYASIVIFLFYVEIRRQLFQ